MKILILNGSPREQGDTARLIQRFQETLQKTLAEIKTVTGNAALSRLKEEGITFTQVSAYHDRILPCVDCRYCITHDHCCLQDDMHLVYEALETHDAVVLASPLFYSELTGRLLDLASRFQLYYYSKKKLPQKRAVLLLAGGGNGGPESALRSAKMICRSVNATYLGAAMSLQTDTIPIDADETLPAQLTALAKQLLLQ